MIGTRLDGATRAWWRFVGRRVDLVGAEDWLDAPRCGPGPVGDSWLQAEAYRLGATVRADQPDGGLLASMSLLDGSEFRAADLDPMVCDFYEHTARWRMEVWSQWSAAFQPGGEVLSRLFGRRVQQLALPTRPLDVAHGMDSRVVQLIGEQEQQPPPAGCAPSPPRASSSTAAATRCDTCPAAISRDSIALGGKDSSRS